MHVVDYASIFVHYCWQLMDFIVDQTVVNVIALEFPLIIAIAIAIAIVIFIEHTFELLLPLQVHRQVQISLN